ncbi:Metallo-dependent phosphatase, partial [Calocera viscosa TUFC12733]
MAISPSPPPSSAPFLVQPFPPPPQPQGTTRFVLISDTHGHPPPASLMPEGDVLIHAGDLGRWGRQDVLDGAIGWLEALPYPVKLVIAGNHDSLLDPSLPAYHAPPASSVSKNRSRLLGPSARKANIHYLEYTSFTFRARPSGREWTVWGSPGSPAYGSPAFQYTSQQAEGVYASLPPGVDILLTHSPPLGPTPLDQTSRGVHAGCKVLARKVRELEVGPWLHVFGHIHEGWG